MTQTIPFNQRLQQVQERTGSLLCVGMDPDPDRLPEHLSRDVNGIREFCQDIIRATRDHVCGYKFNSAFFEVLGGAGLDLLAELRQSLPEPLLAIYDVKRGDIGNTARHYARAAYESLGMDAVTLNPYMGYDAVEPFLADASRGAFILCYTSNDSSRDFQQVRSASGEPLYLQVAAKARDWNASRNVGLVVGATKAAAVAEVRQAAPDLPILAPGVGAQGGDLEAVLQAGRSAGGFGLIIPISRGIIYAGTDREYATQAGEQARLYKTTIQKAVTHE